MNITSTSSAGLPLPNTSHIAYGNSSSARTEGAQLTADQLDAWRTQLAAQKSSGDEPPEEDGLLREKFQEFVGQTFFSELIKSMRTSQKGAAYFNGGRAEEIFQGQFDQMMSERLSETSAQKISDPMFALFQLGRKS